MLKPLLQDDALLREMREAQPPPDGFLLWWLGQSGFLFKDERGYVLIDPYLSDSLTRKYAGTSKPHVRLTERCLDPAALGFVDLVLSTHGHTDHFDPETLRSIAAAEGRRNPLTVVVPSSLEERARTLLTASEVTVVPINTGQRLKIVSHWVTATPAAHTQVEKDAAGRHLYLGYLIEIGSWRVYHSGDTVLHPEVRAAARELRPDLALLPINGNDPRRGVAGNLNEKEAAEFAREFGAVMAIPHHFEMFAFNTGSSSAFATACRGLGVCHTILRCGEKCVFRARVRADCS
jgi:L-ascorbate metabolism protein UlaG (beta-lactamase superfamily)